MLVEQVLERCEVRPLLRHFKIGAFTDASEFLSRYGATQDGAAATAAAAKVVAVAK